MEIPLASSSKVARARQASSEQLFNWFAEPGGKTKFQIKPTPGLSLFGTMVPNAGTGGRGSIAISTDVGKQVYLVAGDTLFHLSSLGVGTSVDTTDEESGFMTLAYNGYNTNINTSNEIIYTKGLGAEARVYNIETDTAANVSNFPGGHVEFMDGYFISFLYNSNKMYISNINDGLTWDALDFTTVDGTPGNIVRLVRNGRDLWVFKTDGTDVYYNSGNADFPFTRLKGAESTIGLAAASAVSATHDKLFWVSSDGDGKGMVWTNEGYIPRRISTPAIETALAGITNWDDVDCWSYQNEGHIFFGMNFTTDNKSMFYDLTTDLWHNRSFWNVAPGLGTPNERMRGTAPFVFNEKTYVCDYALNLIYELSDTMYLDNGQPIRRLCDTPVIHAERKTIFFHNFELDMQRGVGLTTGQGSDPQVMLSLSDDGGMTYGPEHWESAGKVGEYLKKVEWWMMGDSKQRVFRIVTTDPVNFTLMGAYSEIVIGYE